VDRSTLEPVGHSGLAVTFSFSGASVPTAGLRLVLVTTDGVVVDAF